MTLAAGVPIQDILFTVFQSIFQVFLLCLAGFMLSLKGIVDKPTSKVLNHINIALFTPALLFSKVAYFLSPAKLRQLWVIPIFYVVLTGLSALIAHWLARAFHLRRSQVNFATAAAMFMNSNSLPVALMQSLVATVPLLKWGPDDTIDAMFGRSLTYLVVFSTLGMILRWSYGIHLLSQADRPDSPSIPASPTYRDSDNTHDHPALVHVAVDSTAQLIDYGTEAGDGNVWRTRPLRSRLPHPYLSPPTRRNTYPHHRLHSHLPAVPTSLGNQSESEDTDELETTEGESEDTIALPSEPIDTGFSTDAEDTTPVPAPILHPSSTATPASHTTPRWGQPDRSLFMRIFTILTSLSPPLLASLLALFCVLVPPVQRLLNSTEMTPFKGALDNAGGCSVPLTLIVLGGWFWDGEPKPKGKNGHKDGDVKGGSDGRGVAKSKGKGVEKRHSIIPAPAGGRPDPSHAPAPEDTTLHQKHHVTPYSPDSSTTSLSSMIGAFGDVLLAHIHPRSARRAKRRVRGTILANQGDVEPGLLATHSEAEHETAENGHGRTSQSRSRSWADPASPTSPTRGKNPPGETLTIVITLLARMVIVPLIVTPMMVLITRLGWGGEVFEDPVFIVSSMLLIASPPALTLAQISQRAKASASAGTGANRNVDADALSPFERLLSRTVFWAYCALTPPMTILSVMVGLLLVGA